MEKVIRIYDSFEEADAEEHFPVPE